MLPVPAEEPPLAAVLFRPYYGDESRFGPSLVEATDEGTEVVIPLFTFRTFQFIPPPTEVLRSFD